MGRIIPYGKSKVEWTRDITRSTKVFIITAGVMMSRRLPVHKRSACMKLLKASFLVMLYHRHSSFLPRRVREVYQVRGDPLNPEGLSHAATYCYTGMKKDKLMPILKHLASFCHATVIRNPRRRYKLPVTTCIMMVFMRMWLKDGLHQMEEIVGRDSSIISVMTTLMTKRLAAFSEARLGSDLEWYSDCRLAAGIQAVGRKMQSSAQRHDAGPTITGLLLDLNVFAFLDGTKRGISRPSPHTPAATGITLHQATYNGWKHKHSLSWSALIDPSGIIIDLYGYEAGNHHDMTILRQSGLLQKMTQRFTHLPHAPKACGDPAYARHKHVCRTVKAPHLPQEPDRTVQEVMNAMLSSVRVAAEWGFEAVQARCPKLMDLTSQKLQEGIPAHQFQVAVFITNLWICSRGGHVTSSYFDMVPPTLEEYLHHDAIQNVL